jgi:hypothetical protein
MDDGRYFLSHHINRSRWYINVNSYLPLSAEFRVCNHMNIYLETIFIF